MGVLETKICGRITCGDLFKLIVPISISAFCLAAILAYIISPLTNGESPRWNTVGLISVALLSSMGFSMATYSFHLSSSSNSVEWDKQQISSRVKSLHCHVIVAIIFVLLGVSLVVFFAAFAPERDLCAHETCGADVAWSAIAVAAAFLWFIVTAGGLRDMRRCRDKDEVEPDAESGDAAVAEKDGETTEEIEMT